MQTESLPKLVVIDDEPDMARLIADVADMSGYEVAHYFAGSEFVSQFVEDIDVLFLDLIMPDMSGLEIIDFLADKKSRCQLILMTGFEDSVLHTARQAAIAHGLNFISGFKKPFRFDDLHNLLIKLQAVRSSAR